MEDALPQGAWVCVAGGTGTLRRTNLFRAWEASAGGFSIAALQARPPDLPAPPAVWLPAQDRRRGGQQTPKPPPWPSGRGRPTCHLLGRGQTRGLQVGGHGAAPLQGAHQLPQLLTLLLQPRMVLAAALLRLAGRVRAQVQHFGLALVVVTLRDTGVSTAFGERGRVGAVNARPRA